MRGRWTVGTLLLGLAVAALVVFNLFIPPGGTPPAAGPQGTTTSAPANASSAPAAAPSSSDGKATGVPNASGLPAIRESQLPAEGRRTLALIRKGGPYPYSRDGVTFGNFERILPRKASGYYKEYTVPTPGESDRGARRIVAGQAGDKYYTPDHYESFKFIAEGK
ncbi:putative guanyl-specific ribonuclease [Arthrobacter globiformis NBRC 12137]|uniref:Putative guanyl-specific ribonuclease n=1 Tax=Arthrobacter globiformis (strain ATCC 8010 / DSM 20124 / JCM 1332 / NBRC 12137 / NCIMB 8907 / NRRL B-2979 / 168) TaxID=1077972 RepID=H0QLF5_ARTG1|nr:ribonuclease domain-containing protein [Arthrobacter globiformis]GAB13656.1 putative guanyl-specific ribonuclease [Arthrobacter globiformis NBRC 12137]